MDEHLKLNKRQQAKARTRQKVLDAARILFAAEGGYEAATIRSIAKAAGMSTGAVFANFDDKIALYREIYGHAPISPEIGRRLLEASKAMIQDWGMRSGDNDALLPASQQPASIGETMAALREAVAA